MLIVKIISELIIEMVLEKQLRLRIPVPTFSDRGTIVPTLTLDVYNIFILNVLFYFIIFLFFFNKQA